MAGSYTLDEQSEAFVEGLVESGRYETAGDVLRDSLRLMKAREAKLQELRAAIQEGLDSGPMEEIGDMFERIKAEGRKRLAAERGE
ncbi:MAG: type II toxin-antitoxin system ParD family antitoxin [Rhodopseudomonas palustris]|uniref:Type II toxin-antitoxin system ParD family antitoxin n=1 Tax=Rhodopseudomonas palustris TaxID=1076 RepID=A0A933W3G6_RHOPL|nr:type II toxin-antitoxin system ParD family antitoxin [Rhodopseudomonas palustris]